MNLGFNHEATRPIELRQGGLKTGCVLDGNALRHSDAKLLEQGLGLVFVNIHEGVGKKFLLDCTEFGFFRLQQPINFFGGRVGVGLNLFFGALEIIIGN